MAWKVESEEWGAFRARKTLRLTLCAFLVLLVQPAQACNVPVFRYALERWKPDAYQVYVLHKGALTKEQAALVKTLGKYGRGEEVASNLEMTIVDLDKADESKQRLYAAAGKPALPCMVVQADNLDRETITFWTGKLESATIESLVRSTARSELTKRLKAGETAVWVLLESGDKKKDDAAAALLEKELKRLAGQLKLPKLTDNPEDRLATGPPLKIAFSVLRVRKDDTAEAMLRTMLLKSEEGIEKRTEPMAFPIFGRGRTLGGLIGAGLTAENINEGCAMLVAPCSCKFKFQSPGFDLLLTMDWDAIFEKK
jgi:hypothetical protein